MGQVPGRRSASVFVGALAMLASLLLSRERPEMQAGNGGPLRELSAVKKANRVRPPGSGDSQTRHEFARKIDAANDAGRLQSLRWRHGGCLWQRLP